MRFKQINKNRDFVRGYRRGDCYVFPELVVYVIRNRYGFVRTGITSSRKTGKAVKRNRARRVMRRALDRVGIDRSQSFDVILAARGRTAYCKSWQLVPLIEQRLRQSGIEDVKETVHDADKGI